MEYCSEQTGNIAVLARGAERNRQREHHAEEFSESAQRSDGHCITGALQHALLRRRYDIRAPYEYGVSARMDRGPHM